MENGPVKREKVNQSCEEALESIYWIARRDLGKGSAITKIAANALENARIERGEG